MPDAVDNSDETARLPRDEHPTPQYRRALWFNLNVQWEFAFDDRRLGMRERWHQSGAFPLRIVVPYPFQSTLSGIGDTSFHDVVWYRRTFRPPDSFAGKRVILHFGAVDYAAAVWVNGEFAATHEGGHTPFSADVTDLLCDGENVIALRVKDDSHRLDQPRGKQYWEEASEGIFYTRTICAAT